jgi:hypothetical protein
MFSVSCVVMCAQPFTFYMIAKLHAALHFDHSSISMPRDTHKETCSTRMQAFPQTCACQWWVQTIKRGDMRNENTRVSRLETHSKEWSGDLMMVLT